MQLVYLFVLAAVTAVYWSYNRYLAVSQDPKEPPLVPSSVPIIGHLIGLLRHKNDYYVDLREKHSLPIYTLAMPASKVYIVNSVDLISSIQRLHKELAFRPVEAKFAITMCASSKEANDIIAVNLNCENGEWGYSYETHKTIQSALAPGAGLDGMNCVMIRNIAATLERLKPEEGRTMRIGLRDWSRHEITLATTNSVYGNHNPFRNKKVEDAFWEFESGLIMLLVNTVPSLTARKAYRAREFVSKAFQEYFEAKHHATGSMLVQNRYNTSVTNKVPVADIARYEVGGSIALLVNTAPAVFWILFYMYSHPDVLEECRNEVSTIMIVTEAARNTKRMLDITGIKQNCPILTSTFQEVLRQRTLGIQVRQVMQDTMLNNTYLLKKDATIMMPSRVVHTDPAVWGPDVLEFNNKRFTKEARSQMESKKPSPKAFRAFGGGTTLCPGRHFASTEILATVVMMIMRYDLVPLAGQWVAPETAKTNVAAVVMEPDTDVQVEVIPRRGFEHGNWEFGLADSDMVFAVTAEDKEH
ncbi:MAG: hypothetical protein Q9225_006631 [Loekoesia sp. 1 TL-2023]